MKVGMDITIIVDLDDSDPTFKEWLQSEKDFQGAGFRNPNTGDNAYALRAKIVSRYLNRKLMQPYRLEDSNLWLETEEDE